MPRKSLDKCFTDNPIFWERSSCSFPYFRLGQVWAEPTKRVKGLVPCRFLGQRPKPSERKPRSFRAYIFFSIFFITYFTLPAFIRQKVVLSTHNIYNYLNVYKQFRHFFPLLTVLYALILGLNHIYYQ